ncbi:MAG TPA: ribonuclease E inhibitor RraB [Lysobacter sp.]|nr:ribonuclease E inhibitor RraB [Lysobacter sp.]
MPNPFADLRRQLIPDDDTGQVLRQMLDDGDDLARPRDIAFHCVFAEQAQAAAFAAQAAQDGLTVDAPERDEEGIWEVTVVRRMAAEHAAITALERQLAALAAAHGGYPDGWSCSPADGAD